jgi:membrane fusion protein
MALFRAESQQARELAWLGRIVLARPLSFGVLTASALAITVALGLFLALTEYTRKARVTGTLVPIEGVVRVVAQQAGRVEHLAIREGEPVRRGATLLIIGDARAGSGFDDAGAAIAQRLAQRHRALGEQREHVLAGMRTEQAGHAQRRGGIERELAQLDLEVEALRRRVALANGAVARSEELAAIGFVSAAARDRDLEVALDIDARLESMRRSRMGFARELGAVEFEADAARSRAQAQVAAIDTQRAAVDQERIERELQFRSAIAAPAAGVVATVLVEPGQTVAAGATLATLIPEGARLEAQLFSPSRSIGFVRAGQQVLLRYQAYPHQKFGSQPARVTLVSRNPLTPGELGFIPVDGSREPVYRIRAALESQTVPAYGKREPLQAGMQVEADVMLDRRKLIEWVFEPLLSLAGRA